MRIHGIQKAALIGLSLLCLFGFVRIGYCQQTNPSTQNDEARRAALATALERAQEEVKAGRRYVDALKGEIQAKQSQINTRQVRVEKLEAQDASNTKAIAEQRTEIGRLTASVERLSAELRARNTEISNMLTVIDRLKKELATVRKQLKHSHVREKVFGAAAIVLAVLLIL